MWTQHLKTPNIFQMRRIQLLYSRSCISQSAQVWPTFQLLKSHDDIKQIVTSSSIITTAGLKCYLDDSLASLHHGSWPRTNSLLPSWGSSSEKARSARLAVGYHTSGNWRQRTWAWESHHLLLDIPFSNPDFGESFKNQFGSRASMLRVMHIQPYPPLQWHAGMGVATAWCLKEHIFAMSLHQIPSWMFDLKLIATSNSDYGYP